jgi:hypothetical protein
MLPCLGGQLTEEALVAKQMLHIKPPQEEILTQMILATKIITPGPQSETETLTTMPWFANNLIAQALLCSELVQMQKSIAYFSCDFVATKHFITSSLTIPEFPDSKWDNVVRGQPINLDSIFSSVNAIAPVYEHSESLGAYKIKFGGGSSRTSSKKIQTHGDWLMAWTVASCEICHAFPHQARELQDYGNYITHQSSAISQSEALHMN